MKDMPGVRSRLYLTSDCQFMTETFIQQSPQTINRKTNITVSH